MHAGVRWALLCLAAAAAAAAADEESADPRLSVSPEEIPAELAFLQPLIRQAAGRDPATHDKFLCARGAGAAAALPPVFFVRRGESPEK